MLRTRTAPAAPAFRASLPAGPAPAAAGDLPGRGERHAGRRRTSSVRHGAVWQNPGEAAQRAGKGNGGGRQVGGLAWETARSWSPHGPPGAARPPFPGPPVRPRGVGCRGDSLWCVGPSAGQLRTGLRATQSWPGTPSPRWSVRPRTCARAGPPPSSRLRGALCPSAAPTARCLHGVATFSCPATYPYFDPRHTFVRAGARTTKMLLGIARDPAAR